MLSVPHVIRVTESKFISCVHVCISAHSHGCMVNGPVAMAACTVLIDHNATVVPKRS